MTQIRRGVLKGYSHISHKANLSMERPGSVNQMSAPRHFMGHFWCVCRAGLAGALQDACVPERGHRPRVSLGPRREVGTGHSETHTQAMPIRAGLPRPGPVPVPPILGSLIPRGKYSAQEGLAQGDAWRDDGLAMSTNRGEEQALRPPRGAIAPSGRTRRPQGSWAPAWEASRCRSPSAPIKTQPQSQSQTQESSDSSN